MKEINKIKERFYNMKEQNEKILKSIFIEVKEEQQVDLRPIWGAKCLKMYNVLTISKKSGL